MTIYLRFAFSPRPKIEFTAQEAVADDRVLGLGQPVAVTVRGNRLARVQTHRSSVPRPRIVIAHGADSRDVVLDHGPDAGRVRKRPDGFNSDCR